MHFALQMWFGGTLNKLIFIIIIITTIIEYAYFQLVGLEAFMDNMTY